MTAPVVVAPRPLAPPFRAAARRARLVADDDGLRWVDARGRTRVALPAAGECSATAMRLLSSERAALVRGVPRGPLVVLEGAAGQPLLFIPLAEWAASSQREQGDPLRGLELRPLLDRLGVRARPSGGDDALRALSGRAPVAAVTPVWSRLSLVLTVLAALMLAVGTGAGVARGRSHLLAAVGLSGLLLLLAATGLPLLAAFLAERRALPDVHVRVSSGQRSLLFSSAGGVPQVGVRERDGVERWLLVGDGDGQVGAVRLSSTAVDFVDARGAEVLSLARCDWVPDEQALGGLVLLCAEAGVELREQPGLRSAVPPGPWPPARLLWPDRWPGKGLFALGVFLGALNGLALLRGSEGWEPALAAGFFALSAVSLPAWLLLRCRS